MNSKFRVSAIVSTYNSEEFIRGCLQDLIEQTLYEKGKLEIIVIDSASPQDEKSIVQQFQSQYPNIVYQRTATRETIYAAWNRGIKIAQGSYITNANTDDRRRSDALEVMANYLDERTEICLVYADQLLTNVANETFNNTQAEQRFNWPPYSYAELKQRCCVGSQPMWRKSLHKTYGDFRSDFHCAGDYEFWLRLGSHGEKMALIPQILGLYYLNPQGIEYGVPGRASEESKLVRKLYITNQPPKSSFKSLLVPLGSLIVGISLLIFSVLLKAREPWVRVGGILLSMSLIFGIFGYLKWINAKVLRLTRVVLAVAGLAFLVLSYFSIYL
jgi:glycosyltransferase involved in cell wall biosynthesis